MLVSSLVLNNQKTTKQLTYLCLLLILLFSLFVHLVIATSCHYDGRLLILLVLKYWSNGGVFLIFPGSAVHLEYRCSVDGGMLL
jgi:hypothetical protein